MGKIYLIGGGPGWGKSTVAQALAKKHGLGYCEKHSCAYKCVDGKEPLKEVQDWCEQQLALS